MKMTTRIYGMKPIVTKMQTIIALGKNNNPPDDLVVFHGRADISPLLPAALLKGE